MAPPQTAPGPPRRTCANHPPPPWRGRSLWWQRRRRRRSDAELAPPRHSPTPTQALGFLPQPLNAGRPFQRGTTFPGAWLDGWGEGDLRWGTSAGTHPGGYGGSAVCWAGASPKVGELLGKRIWVAHQGQRPRFV